MKSQRGTYLTQIVGKYLWGEGGVVRRKGSVREGFPKVEHELSLQGNQESVEEKERE